MVVEDLGDLRPEVLQLRDKYDLTGMKILQHSFYEVGIENQICYFGTHDNYSLTTWYKDLDENEKIKVKAMMKEKYPDYSVYDGLLQYTFDQPCDYVIISITDVLLEDRRINAPGTLGSPNWEYKLSSYHGLAIRLKKLKKMIEASGR